MPKKCCVFACRTNYASERSKSGASKKIPVYRFPREEEEKQNWIKVIPNDNLTVNQNTVICELHWPEDYEKIKAKGGKLRPNIRSYIIQLPTGIIIDGQVNAKR